MKPCKAPVLQIHPLRDEDGLSPDELQTVMRELWRRGFTARQRHGWFVEVEGAESPLTFSSLEELKTILRRYDEKVQARDT